MKFQHIKSSNLGIMAGTEIFLLGGVILIFYGKLNMDEAWYLYASKLVYQGMLPYRDFAFTQMPLLPYVYGIPQLLLGQSILVGRITSFFFALLSFFIALKVAHRYAGTVGASLAAIFLATFFFGLYHLTIVKTYALVTFFFMLTFFLLSTSLSEPIRFGVAFITIFLAGVTRLSAMVVTAIIFIYVLWVASSNRIRGLALGVFSFLSIFTLLIAATDLKAARWNLFTYHMLPWGDATMTNKLLVMLLVRPLTFIFWESPYTLYLLIIFLFGLLVSQDTVLIQKLKAYLFEHQEILVMLVAMIFFILGHLQTGTWHFEYFVPAIFVLLVILSIGCVKIYHQLASQRSAQTILAGVIGFSLVVFPVQQLIPLLDIDNGETVISRIHQASETILGFTNPEDSLIVLEALWISIESQRDPAPGYTMAQFSYLPFDVTNTASGLKLVNQKILQEDILKAQAKAVILTDLDRLILGSENVVSVCDALHQNYSLASIGQHSKQDHNKIYIYRRNNGSPLASISLVDPCLKP